MDKAKMKKALKDFWYGKPHGERRLGDILRTRPAFTSTVSGAA